eukprot:TRINITY_DN22122_c0_g1_i1.p1 TRINITY_DN22122_c0_g1~~TRINITY_DN22122_c0_g1_i1.p1  ORF type:complete len:371 (+),score=59.62 TRINITY_DN22122_c0_g1_i1:54-1115(+)
MTGSVPRSHEAADVPNVPTVWYDDWIKQNIPDLEGRVAVVTGANSGTGFWCAAALAGKGAQVVLACRCVDKAEAAKQEIMEMHPGANVNCMVLDNMSFASVREFAAAFERMYDRLDLLVNNAGIMAQGEQASCDGYDVQLQTNHLAHFLLTSLLWKKLLNVSGSTPARVVSHASSAHWMGGAKFDRQKLDVPPAAAKWCCFWNCVAPCMGVPPRPWKRYMMSKLCNVLFGLELQRKIDTAGLGSKVLSTMAHPGWASTQLQKYAGDAGSMKGWQKMNMKNAQSAADGSLPLLMACIDESVKGGMYTGPGGKQEMKGAPKLCQFGGSARDAAMAQELWSFSEKSCGVTFVVKGA